MKEINPFEHKARDKRSYYVNRSRIKKPKNKKPKNKKIINLI